MAVDATGSVTSPDSIPTYNTAVDNPSGKGLNNIVAAIQTAMSARIAKSLLTTTGDLIYASGASVAARLGVGSNGQVLTVTGGVPTWAPGAAAVTYRKTTAKAVNTTVAATDLLNGEITVAAGALGTTGVLRLTAEGEWINNSAINGAPPRFQLGLGGTVLIDTSTTVAAGIGFDAVRRMWKIVAEISNLGVANVQNVTFDGKIMVNSAGVTASQIAFATGQGVYVQGGGPEDHMLGYAAGAKDTTGALALTLNVINAINNASYETKLLRALVEVI